MPKVSQYIIGLDEAGRGPWAGPLVAAAFVCEVKDFVELEKLGVKDSKKVSKLKREKIFKELRTKFIIGLGQTTAREIDTLGLQRANVLAIERAILKLPSQFQSLPITLDYIGAFKNYFTLSNQWQMFKSGESVSLAIASASICAKVVRDCLMQRYEEKYPGYGLCKHKGYGTLEHQTALKKLGPSSIHRKSFQPVKSLVNAPHSSPHLPSPKRLRAGRFIAEPQINKQERILKRPRNKCGDALLGW